MKHYLLPLFLLLFTSEVFSQQQEAAGAFVHLTKIEKPPFSENCSEKSPLCIAAIIESYLLTEIIRNGALSKLEAGKMDLPVRVIIDTGGKVSWASIKGLPEEAAKQLAEQLKLMPAFSPGEHQNEKANVIVDLRIPFYFSEAEQSASKIVNFEEADPPPKWKKCRKAKDPVHCTNTAVNDRMNRMVDISGVKQAGSYSATAAFVIGEDGKVGRIVILGGGDEFSDAVMKQLKSLPDFEPGKQAGEPVAVSYILPMFFKKF